MIVTTSVTRIELNPDERDILRKALEILKDVNSVIDGDTSKDIDYVADSADMNLYNSLYDEINRIEDWVMIG